jgi:hypothetical protein
VLVGVLNKAERAWPLPSFHTLACSFIVEPKKKLEAVLPFSEKENEN